MKINIDTRTSIFLAIALLGNAGVAIAATPAGTDEAVTVSLGKVKFNPLLQVFMVSDSAPGVSTGSLNFRVRRAELKFAGPVTESFRWWLMADMAKVLSGTDAKFLQDVGIAYMPVDELEFWIGQFKILTTDDSLEPSSAGLLPDRSVMTRQSFGDRRQTGLAIHFKNPTLKFAVMASNGGQNINDTTTGKDLSTRLELTFLQGLAFGGWLWSPDMDFSNNIAYGAFAKWTDDALMARMEWAQQTAATLTTSGLYVEGGYKVTEQIQPVARFDLLNPPTGFENGYVITGGVNWLHHKHNVKVQAAFSYLNNANGTVGSPVVVTSLATGGTHPTGTMLTLATVIGL